MLMLVAPFIRNFGMPTIPGYLGKRFESGPVRLTAASLAVIPLIIALIAEIKVAALSFAWLVPMSPAIAATIIVLTLVATVAPGGVRSFSWSSAAQAMAMLVAILLPTAIVAIMETNLPFGQLSHGPILRALTRNEVTLGMASSAAPLMAFDIPGPGLQAIAGRYASTFSTIGPVAFVMGVLSIIMGIASSPTLLSRSVTLPTVYDTRKSIGWAVILVGVLLMTFSAIAVFERHAISEDMLSQSGGGAAPGISALVEHNIASISADSAQLKPGSIKIHREGVLMALPILFGLPHVVISLMGAGILAASLAAAASSLTQLGLILAEDVINAPRSWQFSDTRRLLACRLAIAVVATLAATAATLLPGDPFRLFLNSLAFSGSTMFTVLCLSIWWKRLTAQGALAAMITGFGVALAVIGSQDVLNHSIPLALAPVVAVPVSVIAAIVVSQLTPVPERHILELVRDLRIPGGETIYDREVRRARQRGSADL
ncbi:MAG: sodium:solute symporter family transporter, partial [Hyphomicrobiaceae bacterium]